MLPLRWRDRQNVWYLKCVLHSWSANLDSTQAYPQERIFFLVRICRIARFCRWDFRHCLARPRQFVMIATVRIPYEHTNAINDVPGEDLVAHRPLGRYLTRQWHPSNLETVVARCALFDRLPSAIRRGTAGKQCVQCWSPPGRAAWIHLRTAKRTIPHL